MLCGDCYHFVCDSQCGAADVNDKCVSSLLSILQSAPIEVRSRSRFDRARLIVCQELVLSNSTMDQALINKNGLYLFVVLKHL